MEMDIARELAQFGAAGLMGMLWILERRHSALREAQITAAHERLMEQRTALSELVTLVRENTVAMTALERTQRRLIDACERIAQSLRLSPGVASDTFSGSVSAERP